MGTNYTELVDILNNCKFLIASILALEGGFDGRRDPPMYNYSTGYAPWNAPLMDVGPTRCNDSRVTVPEMRRWYVEVIAHLKGCMDSMVARTTSENTSQIQRLLRIGVLPLSDICFQN